MRHIALGRRIAAALAVAGSLALSLVFAASVSAAPIPGHYIVVLKDSVADPGAVANEHGQEHGVQRDHLYAHALKGYSAVVSADKVKALRADPRVQFVSPDQTVEATAQTLPTGVDRIDADTSSTLAGNGGGSVNVNVAILDTGTDAQHPDLNVAGGKSCVSDKYPATSDPGGHGTHVGGTVGALDNDLGVVGVAPGARLWSVRVLDKVGKGSLSEIVCGIDWVTATRTDSASDNDVAVANMSLGGSGTDAPDCGVSTADPVHVAICASVAAGVTYVVAAGNEPADFQRATPAAYDEVLTVAAMADFDGRPGGRTPRPECDYKSLQKDPERDSDDRATSFSSFATLAADQAHTVAAPGLCILSTFPVQGAHNRPFLVVSPGYAYWQGTSMATPHAAGTVALCIHSGACAGLTPAQIIDKIVSDSAAYNTATPGYGFQGDPLRPISGRYYGYLIRAGSY
jgi:subtilisin